MSRASSTNHAPIFAPVRSGGTHAVVSTDGRSGSDPDGIVSLSITRTPNWKGSVHPATSYGRSTGPPG